MVCLALAQIEIIPGNPRANLEQMLRAYAQLAGPDVLAVIFPEMAVPGYLLADIWEREAFLRECEACTADLARSSASTAIIFGNVAVDRERRNEDGRVRKYNALFCAQFGQLQQNKAIGAPFWPKTLLPNYREFDDSRHFFDLRKLANERNCELADLLHPVTVASADGKSSLAIGAMVCEDLWYEGYGISPAHLLLERYPDIDLLLNISSSPYSMGKQPKRASLAWKLVKDTGKPFFYVNGVGTQNLGKTVYCFDGGTGIYLPTGQGWQTNFLAEEALVFKWNKGTAETLSIKTRSAMRPAERILAQATEGRTQTTSYAPELWQVMTTVIKQLQQQWHLQRIVVGTSGGIDSALAAALYASALGAENVFLVNMPSRYNSQLTRKAAKALAHNLGTPFTEVAIDSAVKLTEKQLRKIRFSPDISRLTARGLTLENIQARDRSSRLLAAIAADLGGVFTCNSNKAELTVGYATLYGDAGGFLAVLGDLWKQQIYECARYFNDHIAGKETIPQASLDVVPSAELSPSQDVMAGQGDPLHYPYHDALFRCWVEDWSRKCPEDVLRSYIDNSLESLLGLSRDDVLAIFGSPQAFVADLERWWRAYCGAGTFKRVQTPPILALSRRAFGMDHREVIGLPFFSREFQQLKEKISL